MSHGSGSSPCSHRKNRRPGGLLGTIVPSSMACYGSYARGRRGEISRSAMARGVPWRAASLGDRKPACGSSGSMPCNNRPMPRGGSIGRSIRSTARSSGRINTRPGRKRGPASRGLSAQPERFSHQSTPPRGRERPAPDLGLDTRPAARRCGPSPVAGARSRQTGRAWPPQTSAPSPGGRLGV